MIDQTILFTSFATWKSHQRSNSADDLLVDLQNKSSPFWHFFRQLPVNVPVATELAIAKINQLQPDLILCCGMAENRSHLSLEQWGKRGEQTRQTPIDLSSIVEGLNHTQISQDAGRFVCNGLYFTLLDYLQQQNVQKPCLFVHVPILTTANQTAILNDFRVVIDRLTALHSLRISNDRDLRSLTKL